MVFLINCKKTRRRLKREEVLQFESDLELFEVFITRETGHERKEERIYIKSKNVSWLKNKKWKYVTCLVMAINLTDLHGESIRYYVSSIDLPVEELGGMIRKHWQIENNLHWVLDMYFYEESCHLSVADTGSGILYKDLPHIFERFYI